MQDTDSRVRSASGKATQNSGTCRLHFGGRRESQVMNQLEAEVCFPRGQNSPQPSLWGAQILLNDTVIGEQRTGNDATSSAARGFEPPSYRGALLNTLLHATVLRPYIIC
jgi:hypothetical protein